MTLIASEPIGEDHEIPSTPLALGLAGLAPIIALSLAIALQYERIAGLDAVFALTAYAATALAFLGGAHWGLALRHPAPDVRTSLYVMAVVPALWGWFALIAGGAWGLAMLAVGLGAHGALDAWGAARFAAPRWYPRLRLLLAILATIALTAATAVIATQQVLAI